MSEQDAQLLAVPEVCELLDISRTTLWRWRQDEIIPPDAVMQCGRRVLFRRPVLERWLAGELDATG
jgi:excisionase family DNA binding protein